MNNSTSHTEKCTVCGESIGASEKVIVTCEHSKHTTTTVDITEELGIDTGGNETYSERERELLDELVRLADDLGHSPTLREMDTKGKHYRKEYHDMFGTWNNAKEKAGLETYPQNGPNPQLTDESHNVQVDLTSIVSD